MSRGLSRPAVAAIEKAVNGIAARDLEGTIPFLRQEYRDAPEEFWDEADLYDEDDPITLQPPPGPFQEWDTDIIWTDLPGLAHVTISMWSTRGETDLSIELHVHDAAGAKPRLVLLGMHVL